MSLLWNPNDSATIVEMPLEIITTGTQDMGNGVYWLKAGTPLDEYFAVSNDEDAVYLVAEDFYFISTKPDQAKIVPLITAGYVDLSKAEKASGLTYTDDCIAALGEAGVTLVDGQLVAGGGSSGGGVLVVNIDDNGVLDKTWQEIYDAAPAVVKVVGANAKMFYYVETVGTGGGKYSVIVTGSNGTTTFKCSTSDGYPTIQM